MTNMVVSKMILFSQTMPITTMEGKAVRVCILWVSKLVINLTPLYICLDAGQGGSNKKQSQGAAVPKLTLGKIKVGILDSYKSRSARPAFYN